MAIVIGAMLIAGIFNPWAYPIGLLLLGIPFGIWAWPRMGSREHAIADELQRMIGVAVRVGDPLARVAVSKRIKEPEQVGSLAIAIGLGIED